MSHWSELGRQIVAGRRWLVAMDIVQSAIIVAENLRELGAADVFALGGGMGSGSTETEVPWMCLDVRAEGMMAAIRAGERALDEAGPEVHARLDAWDPERSALVYRAFFSAGAHVAGRPTFGRRPAAWQALEDKTVIDELWQMLHIPHAPFEVCGPTSQALSAARARLDEGLGVVISGDSREGFNGGASYVRWLRPGSPLEDALGFFEAECDQVRVMPFLDGLPCSIHAFVTADGVAVFRPCEMLVFRRPEQATFQYASVATLWQASPEVESSMRATARRIAVHLRDQLGYRGVFTVDGVLTARGFLPTELNPRVGAGIAALIDGLDIPMVLLHYAAIEGFELDWRLDELESLVRNNPSRMARLGVMVPRQVEPRTAGFDLVDGELVEVEQDHPMFTVVLGPAPGAGGYLRIRTTQHLGGAPFGPTAVALIAHVDQAWGLGIGPLEAAGLPGAV